MTWLELGRSMHAKVLTDGSLCLRQTSIMHITLVVKQGRHTYQNVFKQNSFKSLSLQELPFMFWKNQRSYLNISTAGRQTLNRTPLIVSLTLCYLWAGQDMIGNLHAHTYDNSRSRWYARDVLAKIFICPPNKKVPILTNNMKFAYIRAPTLQWWLFPAVSTNAS